MKVSKRFRPWCVKCNNQGDNDKCGICQLTVPSQYREKEKEKELSNLDRDILALKRAEENIRKNTLIARRFLSFFRRYD